MNPAFFQLGLTLAALAIFLYTVTSFFTGAAYASGAMVRSLVAPILKNIRASTPKRREELADVTILVAVALAACATVISLSLGGLIITMVLLKSRPQFRQFMRSEHPLMSLGSQFSADLIIGMLAPLALVYLLLGETLIALSLGAAAVALCWPAGGAGRSSEAWKPAWVAT